MTGRPAGVRRRAAAAWAVPALLLALAGAGLAGATAAAADDEVPADPSFGGTFFLADADDLSDIAPGATVGWNDAVVALPAPGDQVGRLVAPPGAESVVTFVAPQGREADPTAWNASAPWALNLPGLWLQDVTPYHQVQPGTGTPSGVNATAAVSGDYSIGVAYLADAGLRVVDGGLYFVHIHLTGSTTPTEATYTWQPVRASGVAPPAASPPEGGGSGGTRGVLSLVAPAAAGGDGTLPGLTVDDGRDAAAGWTLVVGASAPSAGGAPVALGVAPRLDEGVGVTLGTPPAAGSSPAPRIFAARPAGTPGPVALAADLTFPAAASGTVTLTLVSD